MMPDHTQIRYARAKGLTLEDIRKNLPDDLYRIGDTILVWVNEGDFWLNNPKEVGLDRQERPE